jgi:hypothetical protein
VVLSAVALIVVAGLGIGIGIAVSGGGGGSRTTTTTTTSAQDVADAQKDCALVNLADIQAAFGSAGPGRPDSTGPICFFNVGTTNLGVVIEAEGASQADFNSSRQAAGSGTVDVAGLGGGAYIKSDSSGDTLTVFDTKRAIVFSLYGDQNTKRQLIDLARLMLARA